jgi:hypothetical protein
MTFAHSLTTSSQVDRLQRIKRGPGARSPLNDNNPADGICPACHAPVPDAPTTSDRLGRGRVHEHWLCETCGYEWTTSAHVVS